MLNAFHQSERSQAAWWAVCLTFPALLWFLLWFSINTGPWLFWNSPKGLIGCVHIVRATFPLLVLAASCLVLMLPRRQTPLPSTIGCWAIYGLVGLAACAWSPKPVDAAYWAACYLAVLAAAKIFVEGGTPLNRALWLNRLSWWSTALLLLGMLLVARESLFKEISERASGYNAFHQGEKVVGMALSRSSGLARFAAVPALVALVGVLSRTGWRRIASAAVLLASAGLIYVMQSRGALIAFVFSALFVVAFHGSRSRLLTVPLLLVAGLLWITDTVSQTAVDKILSHVSREQSVEKLTSFTGRTYVWADAWDKIMQAPVFGRGPQADRWLMGQHVHNTYLYALLEAGFVGTLAFAAGLLAAWISFWRTINRAATDRLGHRIPLVTIGGLLAFFTVRGIPEVCGVMFGIDLMVMVPVLLYLGILDRETAILETNPQVHR